MNIIQQQELLKDLSDQDIAGEMQQPSGNVPLYLVAGEAKRRADLRERFKAEQSGPPPTSTVQEDLLSNIMASQMPATGIAQGMPQRQMPMAPPPQQMPMAPPPQQMPAIAPTGEAPMNQIPQAQGIMAGQQGGMAQGFAGGGLVREDRKYVTGRVVNPIDAYYNQGRTTVNPRLVTNVNKKGDTLSQQDKFLRQMEEKDKQKALSAQSVLENAMLEETERRLENAYSVPYSTNPPASMLMSDANRKMMNNPANNDYALDSEDYNNDLAADPIDRSVMGPPRPTRMQIRTDRNVVDNAEDRKQIGILNNRVAGNLLNQQYQTPGDNPRSYDPGGEAKQKVANINPALFKRETAIDVGRRGIVDLPEANKLKTINPKAERKAAIDALRLGNPDPYNKMTARLAERRAALDEDKSGNVAQTLMDLGGRIMAGKSQYGLTNIGEAVSPALKAAQERKAGQTAREDALMASEMGIISGKQAFDKNLRDQANTIVNDSKWKNSEANKDIIRQNALNVDNYNRLVTKEGNIQADKITAATFKRDALRYNNRQELALQTASIDQRIRLKREEQGRIDRRAMNNNNEMTREDQKLQRENTAALRVLELQRKEFMDARTILEKRIATRGGQEFSTDERIDKQEFTAGQSKLQREAKANQPAPIVKALTQVFALPQGNVEEKAFRKVAIGAVTGASKAATAANARTITAFNKSWQSYIDANGAPTKPEDWKDVETYMPTDALTSMLIQAKKGRGGSGGTGKGRKVNLSGARKLTQG